MVNKSCPPCLVPLQSSMNTYQQMIIKSHGGKRDPNAFQQRFIKKTRQMRPGGLLLQRKAKPNSKNRRPTTCTSLPNSRRAPKKSQNEYTWKDNKSSKRRSNKVTTGKSNLTSNLKKAWPLSSKNMAHFRPI